MTKELAFLTDDASHSPIEDVALLCQSVYNLNGRLTSRSEIADALAKRGYAGNTEEVDQVLALLPSELQPAADTGS